MSTTSTGFRVHSRPSGGHWVAWVTAGGDAKPAGAAILVGRTQEEAEANARSWGERLDDDPRLLRAPQDAGGDGSGSPDSPGSSEPAASSDQA